MQQTISFSLKEETLLKLKEKLLQSNSYRNKSHLVECAIEEYLKEITVEQNPSEDETENNQDVKELK